MVVPPAGHRAMTAGTTKLSKETLGGAAVGVATASAPLGLEPPPQPCNAKVRLNTENRQRRVDIDTFCFLIKERDYVITDCYLVTN